ncbi:MAG TPA: glycoside hydrolase family 28 protein, partial [Polyangia bacterium]|nr:glycoside hydrolase family 28 protein [Polyangia bacterium]
MKRLALLVLVLAATRDAGAAPPAGRKVGPAFYDVRSYGAVGDGKTKATAAVRKAIDAAAAA